MGELIVYSGLGLLLSLPTLIIYACALIATVAIIRRKTPYITGTITAVAALTWLVTAAYWSIWSLGVEPVKLTPEEAAIVFEPGADPATTTLLLRDHGGGVSLDRLAAETKIQTVIRSAEKGDLFCTGSRFLVAQLRPGLMINTSAWKPLLRKPSNYILYDSCPKTGLKVATQELVEIDGSTQRLLNVSFKGKIGDRTHAIFPPFLVVNARGIYWATQLEGGGVVTTEESRLKDTTDFIVRGING